MRTAERIIEKFNHWSTPATLVSSKTENPENLDPYSLRVLSPRMWPSFSNPIARKFNSLQLTRALTPEIEKLNTPPTAITTLPIVADLVDKLPVKNWIYYCVDDFSVWPGYDGKTMGEMERRLIPKMHATIAASESIAQRLALLGKSPTLITHGVDLELWNNRIANFKQKNPFLKNIQAPFIVFWGVIDKRMDVEWLAALSQALESQQRSGSIILFGPQEDPDSRLKDLPRVFLRPSVAYDKLPSIAAHADVLIMPYGNIPATRAMQPLKLKEYLATGLPVVVRELPSTRNWADACDVCSTQQQFVDVVLARLTSKKDNDQLKARSRLKAETWHAKASILNNLIESLDQSSI
jgi:glycosyltransferase involved in cell wall biosynthesis